MKPRLEGKVAVITGSTYGIGYFIAERLAQEGAKVVVSSRSQENVNKAVEQLTGKGLDVIGVKCHVANGVERKVLYEKAVIKYGGIDILVSNVGVNPEYRGVLSTSESAWDKVFEVNVKCAFLLAKEAVPYIRQRQGGSIIFVSSIVGLSPHPGIGAYSVSKTALLGLTKAASQELAKEGIRVNCIAPGVVMTNFLQNIHADETTREAARALITMGRFAQPEEISGTCAFLASEDASYITGEIIAVAGGWSARL